MSVKTILVIEDDPVVRENIQVLLEETGYNVVTADDGRQGIALAARLVPDMIFCDIMMPQRTGYDVLETLRSASETALVPFVFLTAKSETADMRRGMQLGADDFIMKPYKANDLLQVAATQIKKKLTPPVQPVASPRNTVAVSPPAEHELFLAGSTPEVFKFSDITHIRAEEEYSIVYTCDAKKHMVRRLLKEWEEHLPASTFLRIHRSFLINLNHVSKIEKWFNHAYRVFLKNVDEPLVMSRRYSTLLRAKVKERTEKNDRSE
jgi:DNA-binding LytR/AlgR family response regulator